MEMELKKKKNGRTFLMLCRFESTINCNLCSSFCNLMENRSQKESVKSPHAAAHKMFSIKSQMVRRKQRMRDSLLSFVSQQAVP